MATKALAADQTTQEHVEEVKSTDDAIKDVDKDICPESKDLEGKDGEKIKLEDLAGAEASTAESVAAIASEEKQEDKKDVPVAEEVKKEEAEDEKTKQEDKKDAPVAEEVKKEEAEDEKTKQEDKKDVPVAEEVKKEEAEDEKICVTLAADATEIEEISKQEADSSTADLKVGADSSAAVEPAVEAVEKELKDQVEVNDVPEPPEPLVEALAGDSQATSVQESEPEPAKKPTVSELAAQEVGTEAAAEEVNATPGAAAVEVNTTPEAAAEVNTTPEAVAEEVTNTPEAATEVVVSVTEGKRAELPIVSPVTELAPDVATTCASEAVETSQGDTVSSNLEESIVTPKDAPSVTDSSIPEEVSEIVPEAVVFESAVVVASKVAPVKEIKEEGEAAAVTEEVPSAPESAEGDQNVAASAEESIPVDTNHFVESVVDKVEEAMQEKAVVAEEPIVSDTTTAPAATQVTEVLSEASVAVEKVEKKEARVEGSFESSKDLVAAAEVPQDTSLGQKASKGVENKKDGSSEGEKATLVEASRDIDVEEGKNNVSTEGEKTEKDDEKTPIESEKGVGEAPKAEAPAKSQRQSNNIFSKVKQSIVKVKKAIVGKSPSLKAVPVEGKDEIKVK